MNITGATGDGNQVQYRIETVEAGTADTLIFKNADAGFLPPYFKFDSARLQSVAGRVSVERPQEAVDVNSYGLRITWLNKSLCWQSLCLPGRGNASLLGQPHQPREGKRPPT